MKEEIIQRGSFPEILSIKEYRITLSRTEETTLMKALTICSTIQTYLFAALGIDPDYDNDYMDDDVLGGVTRAIIGLERMVNLRGLVAVEIERKEMS